jgi:hypothetical protein
MSTYRHFYKQAKAASPKQWAKIKTDVEKLLTSLPPNSESAGGTFRQWTLMIGDASGAVGSKPTVTDDEIALNGVHGKVDLSHETFWITRSKNTEPDADYCKTARKPYDLVVCGILIVLQHHAPGVWKISTNGTLEDWDPAREWVESILGYAGFDEVLHICGEVEDASDKRAS